MTSALRSRFSGDRQSRRDDVTAAVLLTFIAIPAGMGYAQVAGLSPAMGLTATVVGLFAYALVGPSPVFVIGPDSSLAPMIAAALVPMAAPGDRRVALGSLLALMVGVLMFAGGRLRLGRVADLLAKPIRVGFLDGVAVVIVASQLPRVFGLASPHDEVGPRLAELVADIAHGRADRTAAALGAGTIAFWALLGRKLGAAALATSIVVMTAVTVLADAHEHVAVVGSMRGAWSVPPIDTLRWSDVSALIPAAGGIAVVAFADSVTLSRSLADRRGARSTAVGGADRVVDESAEMQALGLTNVAVAAFGGFPVSASSSRTPAAIAAGGSSHLCLVTAGMAVAALMLLAPGATEYVPVSVLSAAVIVTALQLIDVAYLLHLWRVSRADFAISFTAFVGVMLFDVLRGIGLAIALAVALFVARSWKPHSAELVRVDARKGYHDRSRHPEGRRIPGLAIARFDAPLFFANATTFSRFVMQLVDGADPPVRRVILAAEPITDVDATAADELRSLLDHLDARRVEFDLAEVKGPVKDRLHRYGLDARLRAFPTIGTAVDAYLRETGTPWVDWEDRASAP